MRNRDGQCDTGDFYFYFGNFQCVHLHACNSRDQLGAGRDAGVSTPMRLIYNILHEIKPFHLMENVWLVTVCIGEIRL